MLPDFYKPYVNLLSKYDINSVLLDEYNDSFKFYNKLDNKIWPHRYANNKWSVKEILGHVCDAEQVFAYRLMSFLRKETKSLPGFDENNYVKFANFDQLDSEELIYRFSLVRKHSIILSENLNQDKLNIIGEANGSQMSVKNLILVIAGHELHHRNIIRERYL